MTSHPAGAVRDLHALPDVPPGPAGDPDGVEEEEAEHRLGRARTVAVVGLEPIPVVVEVHVGPGLPGISVIGSSRAAGQSAERVKTALKSVGVTLPQCKVLVSLAPADLPKGGARYDLAMAIAILGAVGHVDGSERCFAWGELMLDGTVRGVPGVLPALRRPLPAGSHVLVADANAAEARLAGVEHAVPVRDLAEVLDVLSGHAPARACPAPPAAGVRGTLDLADVRGQHEARRALEIAAAGGHHVLLLGPPGCGKSMLAARLPGILPPLAVRRALELASVRSVAGRLRADDGLDLTPPFVAPHHTTSAPSLLGGGSGFARPGAISLAHGGVLFMDELFEWPRSLLDCLREPLEEGVIHIARSQATVTYPAVAQVVAAGNPCPCGGGEGCACPDDVAWAYRARLSGALADRLDLAPAVEPLTGAALLAAGDGEPSVAVARRVAAARAAADARWNGRNAEAPTAAVRATASPAALRSLATAVDEGRLTGRGFDRSLRVARTIADLAGEEVIARDHTLEALAHRGALGAVRAVRP